MIRAHVPGNIARLPDDMTIAGLHSPSPKVLLLLPTTVFLGRFK